MAADLCQSDVCRRLVAVPLETGEDAAARQRGDIIRGRVGLQPFSPVSLSARRTATAKAVRAHSANSSGSSSRRSGIRQYAIAVTLPRVPA